MTGTWVAVLVTGVLCFVLKITTLIPIVLLSALVGIQAFTTQTKFTIDHRLSGIVIGAGSVIAKLPFPVTIILAMTASAITYRVKI
jgi:hypothetical protein